MMHNVPEHDEELMKTFQGTGIHFIVVVIFPRKDDVTKFVVIDLGVHNLGHENIDNF